MSKQLALFLCIVFIVWLFFRDKKLRPLSSGGLWFTLLWITIVGSRPVSSWFTGGVDPEVFNYLEGSPFDRNVFLLLIIGGLTVLLRRNVNWRELFASNRWFFAFFLYCLISIFWSEYPFVSFKRWTKELGNIIMILILLTETDPVHAVKAVFSRFTYVVIPLSVVFIKYFPDIGRYYNSYTWTVAFGGITINKNTLGSVLLLCGLFLIWDLIESRNTTGKTKDRLQLFIHLGLLAMVLWLLVIAKSSTAMVCLVLGAGILFLMRYPIGKRQARHLGVYSLAIGVLLILFYSFPAFTKTLTGMLGKDTTFTGRTELWSYLIRIPLNPLIGTGYQSFWLGPRAEGIWENFNFHPVQAHNGYLEIYLNLGLVGLCLLSGMVASAASKLKKEVLNGSNYGVLRFSFLFVVILYNWTEAMFSGLNIMWITLLIFALTYPRSTSTIPQQEAGTNRVSSPSGREISDDIFDTA